MTAPSQLPPLFEVKQTNVVTEQTRQIGERGGSDKEKAGARGPADRFEVECPLSRFDIGHCVGAEGDIDTCGLQALQAKQRHQHDVSIGDGFAIKLPLTEEEELLLGECLRQVVGSDRYAFG